MNELVTTDTIISFLQERVTNKEPIAPNMWMDAAMKLNVLLGDESDILFDLQQKVAEQKIKYSLSNDGKRNVSQAKMLIEATDIYKQMRKQEAKIERIIEFIRLSKVQARMHDAEWTGQ